MSSRAIMLCSEVGPSRVGGVLICNYTKGHDAEHSWETGSDELTRRLVTLVKQLQVTGHPLNDEQLTERLINAINGAEDKLGTVRHGPEGETAVKAMRGVWVAVGNGKALSDAEVADWTVGTPVEGTPADFEERGQCTTTNGGVRCSQPGGHLPPHEFSAVLAFCKQADIIGGVHVDCTRPLGHAGVHQFEPVPIGGTTETPPLQNATQHCYEMFVDWPREWRCTLPSGHKGIHEWEQTK